MSPNVLAVSWAAVHSLRLMVQKEKENEKGILHKSLVVLLAHMRVENPKDHERGI